MALVVASAANRVSNPFAASVTTSQFAVVSGDLLVACGAGLYLDTTTPVTDSQSGTWALAADTGEGFVVAAVREIATGGNITVTLNGYGGASLSLQVYKVTGWVGSGANDYGATGSGWSKTNNYTATLFTSTSASGAAIVSANEAIASGAPTSSDLTSTTYNETSYLSALSGYKAVNSIGSITANLDAAGTSSAEWHWAAVEILAAPDPVRPRIVGATGASVHRASRW